MVVLRVPLPHSNSIKCPRVIQDGLLVGSGGFLVSRFRRGQFIPAIYLFFISHLLLFAVFFEGDSTPLWLQRTFYIWLSVFNLFVVSVFWSFMADIFRPGQAQRLFGFIMAGGSIGAIIAPSITKGIVPHWGATGVMLTVSTSAPSANATVYRSASAFDALANIAGIITAAMARIYCCASRH